MTVPVTYSADQVAAAAASEAPSTTPTALAASFGAAVTAVVVTAAPSLVGWARFHLIPPRSALPRDSNCPRASVDSQQPPSLLLSRHVAVDSARHFLPLASKNLMLLVGSP